MRNNVGNYLVSSCTWMWLLTFPLQWNYIGNPSRLVLSNCYSNSHFNFNGNKARSGLQLIWHATIWLIRKVRNDRLFNNCVVMAYQVVYKFKVLSWPWFLCRMAKSPCLLLCGR